MSRLVGEETSCVTLPARRFSESYRFDFATSQRSGLLSATLCDSLRLSAPRLFLYDSYTLYAKLNLYWVAYAYAYIYNVFAEA